MDTVHLPSGFEVVLDSVTSASETSRRHLDGLAELLPALTLRDLRMVVTELVNNSVMHGSGDPIVLAIDVTPVDWSAAPSVTGAGSGEDQITAGSPRRRLGPADR